MDLQQTQGSNVSRVDENVRLSCQPQKLKIKIKIKKKDEPLQLQNAK
jgi:hypothetical protein